MDIGTELEEERAGFEGVVEEGFDEEFETGFDEGFDEGFEAGFGGGFEDEIVGFEEDLGTGEGTGRVVEVKEVEFAGAEESDALANLGDVDIIVFACLDIGSSSNSGKSDFCFCLAETETGLAGLGGGFKDDEEFESADVLDGDDERFSKNFGEIGGELEGEVDKGEEE